jgi:hypothetical protein
MKILYWARRAATVLQRKVTPLQTLRVTDTPDVVERNTLYLVGSKERPWAAMLLCPCSCGATIGLNLVPEAHPCWTIRTHWDSTATLSPSINRTVGCRSHFWIKSGVVDWAMSEPRRRRS